MFGRVAQRGLWFGIIMAVLAGPLFAAEPVVHTRAYRVAGSYPSVVSIAPNGSVLSKSGDSSFLTLFDGYTQRVISMPDVITYRVHQSRSGQIWCATADGLLLYHAGAWTNFTLPEIRAFLSGPAHHLRQIGLLPAEVNHVFVLLPDRLLDFNATLRQTGLLRAVNATSLGEFSEIQEGADESVWISGMFGFARIPGPVRRITAQSPWTEFILPHGQTNSIHNLQRPFEAPSGIVTAAAINLASETRAIVQFASNRWSSYNIRDEKVRQAWQAWDGQTWGLSTASLFELDDRGGETAINRLPVSGPQYDLAVETNGVFWVASGEGLVRYAPELWRTPRSLQDLQVSVHSMLLEADGTVWIATPGGLICQSNAGRRLFPWPEEIENLPPRQGIYRLPNGSLVIGGQRGPIVLNPSTGRFRPLPSSPDSRPHAVGQLSDGAVVIWFEAPGNDSPPDLRRMNGDTFEPLRLPPEQPIHGDISFVKEAGNGDLWICNGPSLFRFRKSTGTLEHHGSENGLRTDRIYAFADIGDGRFWCATASRIFEYRGQRWEPILHTMDRVTDIVPAQGSIWVSTLGGLHRYLENAWFTHGPNEGIPPGAIYSLRAGPDERAWAATSRGVFSFHPDADTEPPFNRPPELEEEQQPTAGQPTVLRFRGQDKWDYTFPNELLFSYRLDEGVWTPYSNMVTRVFYKLSAGSHTVEVQSMDRNGNKSIESSKIEFAVIVPWSSDPRLLSVLVLALVVTLVLAVLAINRHIQLKRSYAAVEKIVEERTRDLNRATQELVHAQKMRALGTMAAGIAHDFNNILSIIKGSAQIIEGNVEDKEKIRTRVNRIQTVVEQGSVIVKALLGLGKTGEKELSECDVSQLLHQTRKILADRFPSSVQIQINVASDLPLVLCAPEVIQQILLNLILNAAEAMHNSGVVELAGALTPALPPKLVLEPERQENAGACIMISVVDSGGGIAPENLPRIFEPFFTTKALSSRRGTGLGLSMVYELAKQLGYGLAVESRLGEGSRFSILVPVPPPKVG